MARSAVALDAAQRGVYELPFFTADDQHIAVALDGEGRCLAWVNYRGPEQERAARKRLWTILKLEEPARPPTRLTVI